MQEEEVGIVIKFFSKPSVAAIELTKGDIKKGDQLHFKGAHTDFTEEVSSMEMDNKAIEVAKPGDMIGIKVKERVRPKDKVYKVVE